MYKICKQILIWLDICNYTWKGNLFSLILHPKIDKAFSKWQLAMEESKKGQQQKNYSRDPEVGGKNERRTRKDQRTIT